MQRQAQQKKRRAVNQYNQKVKTHNQKVQRAVNDYNREVRAHNARVRSDRQRLKREIARLNRQTSATRYVTFRVSVDAVQTAYTRLEDAAERGQFDERYNELLDLSEREAANSAGLMNALIDEPVAADAPLSHSTESPLTPILQSISNDLGQRWHGAIFSLSPQNPDAARHFCTSAREIIAGILNTKAPDDIVVSAMPNCERTQQGTPTRRAKIRYFLHVKKMEDEELESFVDNDMENVIQLFHTFNEGTHGAAGTFNHAQLQAIRKRVEDGIIFLSRLVC